MQRWLPASLAILGAACEAPLPVTVHLARYDAGAPTRDGAAPRCRDLASDAGVGLAPTEVNQDLYTPTPGERCVALVLEPDTAFVDDEPLPLVAWAVRTRAVAPAVTADAPSCLGASRATLVGGLRTSVSYSATLFVLDEDDWRQGGAGHAYFVATYAALGARELASMRLCFDWLQCGSVTANVRAEAARRCREAPAVPRCALEPSLNGRCGT